jgi:hypothetical protein
MRVGRKVSLVHLACCGFLIFGATSVNASPVDIGYPPPGGVTFSCTVNSVTCGSNPPFGPSSATGTALLNYSNLNPAAYGNLYYGIEGISMGQVGGGTGVVGLPEPFPAGVSGIGTSTLTLTAGIGVEYLPSGASTPSEIFVTGTFTATLLGGLTWQAPSAFGITQQNAGPYAFVDLTGLTSFALTEAFTVGGVPFDQWYNGLGNTLGFQDSHGASGDFQVTPLPAALPLFATGLGGLGLLGWRRKRKAQAIA